MKPIIKVLCFFAFVFRPQKGVVDFFERERSSKKGMRKNIIAANKVLRKIRCPEKWGVYISHDYYYAQIMYIHHDINTERSPLESYKSICEQIEKYGKLTKCFSNSCGMNSLDADGDVITYKGGKIKFRIVQLQVDKCDIEWREEVVKKPILSGFCAEAIK